MEGQNMGIDIPKESQGVGPTGDNQLIVTEAGQSTSNDSESGNTPSLLGVTSLITPEMMDDLSRELQLAVTRATTKRKLTAFGKGTRAIGDTNNPVLQGVVTAIYGVLDRFFDHFFADHPELDQSMKGKILDGYKESLDTIAKAFAQAENPEAAQKAQNELVEKFLYILENNPKLRDLQITALKGDLKSYMQSTDTMYIPSVGEKGRKHGERDAWQNTVGMSLIITEALATGFAMSNGISNEAFRNGITLTPGASYLPGTVAAFLTALGGQALARAILREKKPGEGIFATIRNRGALQVGALAVALSAGTIAVGDYELSKSAVGVGAATTGEVKGRTASIMETLGGIITTNDNKIQQGTATVKSAVDTIRVNEANRGGAFLFYSLKSVVLTGTYQGLGADYDTPAELRAKAMDLDTKKGTTIVGTIQNHDKVLSTITYVDPALQAILRDPKVSYEAKMRAIGAQYMSLFSKSRKAVSELQTRASQPPHLTGTTMLLPSQIGEFADGNDAQRALAQLGHTLKQLPQELQDLRAIETQLKDLYMSTLRSLEEDAKKAFAGNTTLAKNTLPPDLNLGLQIPDTSTLATLASSPLTNFQGLSTDQAMKKVGEVYGPQVQSEVSHFILLRAALFVGMLGLGQGVFLWSTIRRRAKNADEIEAVGAECMKQVNVIVDTLYAWTGSSLSRLMKREDGSEIVSRSFCEHIVWSWLIDVDPSLREFAPPTYLGEKAGEKGWKNTFMQLLTCDVRPDTDRRTESLYQIFRYRIRTGSLMNDRDIGYIMSQFQLGNGNDIARRVNDLSASIAAGSAEYELRAKRDPSEATYLAQSKLSLSAQKDQELQIMREKILAKYIQALQNLGNSVISGEFVRGTEVLAKMDSLDGFYKNEAEVGEGIIKAKYQISPPEIQPVSEKSSKTPKKPKVSWRERVKNWLPKFKTPSEVKAEDAAKSEAPPIETGVPVIVSLQCLTANIAGLESRLSKHNTWIEMLKGPGGKERFIQEVLGGDESDIDLPDTVFTSVHSIEKYRTLMVQVDNVTDEMESIRDTMDGESDIGVLQSILIELAEQVDARQQIIDREGAEFSGWIGDISTLLDGFDSVENHMDTWEPKKIEDAPVEPNKVGGEISESKGPATQRLAQVIAQVARNKAFTLEEFQIGIPVEMTFKRGGCYSVTRNADDTFDIQSLDNPSELSWEITLEDLNRTRGI